MSNIDVERTLLLVAASKLTPSEFCELAVETCLAMSDKELAADTVSSKTAAKDWARLANVVGEY